MSDEMAARVDWKRSYYAEADQSDALRKECEALRRDAERYRWLRDVGDETWVPMGRRPGVNFTHQIDQAIDAAIARARGIGAA